MPVVDPEIKQRLDRTIQEARQALESINGGGNTLAEEERKIRGEDTEFKKKFVRCCSAGGIIWLKFVAGHPQRSEEESS